MKKLFFLLSATFVFSPALLAQQPNPTPPKADDSVVKITTNLIQIDVTVTDKNGKVVTGLKPEDFEIRENGEIQKVSNLTFISKTSGAVTAGAAGQVGKPGQASSKTPLTPGQVGRTIAIVVDDLNLSFASVYFTRQTLRKFVEEQMEPNDLVAIIRTGRSVGALQQFTSDKLLLMAAIERIRWNPLGASGINPLTSTGQTNEEVTERFSGESDAVANQAAGGGEPLHKSILTRENVSDKKATDYNVSSNANESEVAMYTQAGIASIKYIIGGMNELPGRKLMMLLSDGITINEASNKSRANYVIDRLQDLVDYAYRSSVVVYTFDTRGLQSMEIAASDPTYEIIDGHRQQKVKVRMANFKASQDGLVFLATQTGGKYLLDSNNLNGGIQRALDDQSGYYLVGYIPDADTFDPAKRKYNKLEVKVNQPGLNVSSRSGFFNSNQSIAAAAPQTAENKIAQALMSPFTRSEIALDINALYADDPVDGAYVRSFLHIDAKNLTFTEDAEGWKKAKFDVVAVSFGDNGVPVDDKASDYTIKAKGSTYDNILKNGFVYVLIMPIKTPGVYQYRVAVRDSSSGKIGTASQVVEVPNLKKQKLAISSLAVENVSTSIWQNITQGKVGTNPGQIRVASTLLYDTVVKQFPAGTVLRYGFEVYNAKLDGKSLPQIETQAMIMQNDRTLVEGKPIKFDPAGQQDLKHTKISGAIMLKDTLTAGDYVLQIIVTDTLAKQKSVQLFPFEIINH